MIKPEHIEIAYALEKTQPALTLRWILVERGLYPTPQDISYVHPHPAFNRLFCFLRGGPKSGSLVTDSNLPWEASLSFP